MADHLISVMGMADASALGSDVSSATAATVMPRVISPPGVPDLCHKISLTPALHKKVAHLGHKTPNFANCESTICWHRENQKRLA